MTLMPVARISVLGLSWANSGGALVDGARLAVGDRALVDRLAEQVEHAAEDVLADGHGHGAACVEAGHAATQAVGGAEGDGADAAAAEVLLHLADELEDCADLGVALIDRVVDVRELILGELASKVEPMTCVIVPVVAMRSA
jgi:hypothetical protein